MRRNVVVFVKTVTNKQETHLDGKTIPFAMTDMENNQIKYSTVQYSVLQLYAL